MVLAVNSASCNAMAAAFATGKQGQTFKLGVIDWILDYFSGRDKATATKLMNDLGKLLKTYNHPKSNVFDKLDARNLAQEFLSELKGMVNDEDRIEFSNLIDPIFAMFKFEEENSADMTQSIVVKSAEKEQEFGPALDRYQPRKAEEIQRSIRELEIAYKLER